MSEEILEIKKKFDKIIEYSQGISDPKTEELFSIWASKKNYFYKAFGDKYIYEFPDKISFDLSESEKHQRIFHFISLIEDKWRVYDLANFIEAQEEGFFKNVTVKDFVLSNGKIIKKGEKLVKTFKYFVDNEKCLIDIQNAASRIIQEDKIEGKLCFSVHPLDFLSLSENAHNWRTCHSLDGDYVAGNLSYMMDSCTFICYLKAEKDTKLPNFPDDILWNSKKWRILFYLSEDHNMIMAGKPYPFSNPIGMEKITDLFNKNISEEDPKWTEWLEGINTTKIGAYDISLSSPHILAGYKLLPLNSIFKNACGAKQYNDVLTSSTYSPLYCIRAYEDEETSLYFDGSVKSSTEKSLIPLYSNKTKFEVGAKTICLKCGVYETLLGEGTIMCGDCELNYGIRYNDNIVYCDFCGRRVFYDDITLVEDEYVCSECLHECCKPCDCCEEYFEEHNLIFCEETETYLCKYCREDE